MCGFAGIVGVGPAAAPTAIEAMSRALVHRGPDDFGTWQQRFRAPGVAAGDDGVVALGHTRLSVIDLSPLGHQPMLSEDGRTAIAYNGEVYNFAAVRSELEAAGHRFRSHSDTEVFLEAYRAWGLDCFTRFVGMFALAIWDGDRNRLVLARDRLGIKPLYYRFRDGLLTFGSELGALRAHPAFRPEIDRRGLGLFLRYGYVPGPGSIYADTRRVMPGELVVWEDGALRASTYWDANGSEGPPRDLSRFEDAVDALDEVLGDAVESRLVADVPLGVFLSGGVDSSTVTALMQERSSSPVRSFTIGIDEPSWDEAPYARAVAEHLKTDHTELYVGRAQAQEVACELPALYDEPFADSSAIPTVLLSRLTRDHVTVALSGDGGDELFGGYPHHARLGRMSRWLALPRALRAPVAAVGGRIPRPAWADDMRLLSHDGAEAAAHSLVSRFEESALAGIVGEEAAAPNPLFGEAFRSASGSPVHRAMHADLCTYLPDDILAKVDRASMSVALEARVPVLDHRVVRLAQAMSMETIWHGGETKAPLRAVLYRRVPRRLIERPKRGFGIPLGPLLSEHLPRWRERFLSEDRLREEGLLDPTAVRDLAARADLAQTTGLRSVWYLICFERWFAHHHRGEANDG